MPTLFQCKLESAENSVKALVDRIRSIEAILLFGSVARGDVQAESDIDLMVIASDPIRSAEVRGRRSARSTVRPRSPATAGTPSRRPARTSWSFFVHLREEGEVLYGGPRLMRSLDRTRRPDSTVWKGRLRTELDRLDRFDDLDRYSAGYNLPLARIFRSARYSCMLENTAAGETAFSRDACFDIFARRHPEVSAETEQMERLWPFHARTQGRQTAAALRARGRRGRGRGARGGPCGAGSRARWLSSA